MRHEQLARALEALVSRLDAVPGLTGSAVLYGSAARGDWDPERSDVNLLLVVDAVDPASLAGLAPACVGWHEAGMTPPLLIGRAEWERATDVFPIELTDMQASYQLLWGEDPIAGLRVESGDLRRAVETSLRGKLVRLRQAYVRFHDAPPILGGFATASTSEFLVLMRATAHLLGRGMAIPPEAVLDALAPELGEQAEAVRRIVGQRREAEWSCAPELFAGYLGALERLVGVVDHLYVGAR